MDHTAWECEAELIAQSAREEMRRESLRIEGLDASLPPVGTDLEEISTANLR